MSLRTLIIIILVVAAIVGLPLLLQDRTFGEGQLILLNEAGVSLDRSLVEDAARNLIDERAVDLAIYIVSSGTEIDFHQRLRKDGLVNSRSQLESRGFAIYIGINNRYSEIGWGATLSTVNGSQIRREILNPRLQEGDYTGAIVNALNVTSERFNNPYSMLTSLFANVGALMGSNPTLTIILLILGGLILGRLMGWLPENSGTSSSSSYNDQSYYDDNSSSIDFGSSDSGGGFDGGSWDD